MLVDTNAPYDCACCSTAYDTGIPYDFLTLPNAFAVCSYCVTRYFRPATSFPCALAEASFELRCRIEGGVRSTRTRAPPLRALSKGRHCSILLPTFRGSACIELDYVPFSRYRQESGKTDRQLTKWLASRNRLGNKKYICLSERLVEIKGERERQRI